MLSRVANSIYWMSRYMERAENTARLIAVNMQLTLDRADGVDEQWSPMVGITGDQALFNERYDAMSRANVMQFLTLDRTYPNSITSCVAAARENARTIRDVITTDMWEQINTSHIMLQRAEQSRRHADQPHKFYTDVKLACQLFDAVTDGTLSHTIGWEFSRLGRMLERADMTSRVLDVKYFLLLPRPQDVGSALDIVQWAALLRSAGALTMYRQSHGAITPANVVSFLMLDTDFPRSLGFCLNQANDALTRIIGSHRSPETVDVTRRLGRLRSDIEFGDVDEMIEDGLHEYLDKLQKNLNGIGDAIDRAFFRAAAAAKA